MNKRALYFGIAYSVLVIIYKLIILLGGYQLTNFGFYYSHIISVFAVIPFMILAIKQVRDNENSGVIGGRDALRIALTVFGVAVVILSCYTYVEFIWKMKEISVQYYNGAEYLKFLERQAQANPTKLNPGMFKSVIEENIANLSAMKAVTAKLFSFFLLSFSFSFIIAVFMKKK